MRSVINFILLFALALGSVSAEAARPFAAICRTANWMLGREKPASSASVVLTPEETSAWQGWLALHSSPHHTGALVFERDTQLLVISELPIELRRKIFSNGTEAQVRARLKALGASVEESPLLDNILLRFHWAESGRTPANNGYELLEREIASTKPLAGDARAKALDDARLLVAVDRTKAVLMDDRNPQYQLRFDGNQIIVPDGKRYDFTRAAGGKLKIFIPYRDLIQHQDYENGGIIAKYFGQFFNGWRGLDGGALTPDGRYFMADTYHRSKAYAMKHAKGGDWESTPVPMLVSPAADGKFYTKTHWSILASTYFVPNRRNGLRWSDDKTWSFLPAAERDRLIERAQTDPVGAVRDYYYSSTGLSRLE